MTLSEWLLKCGWQHNVTTDTAASYVNGTAADFVRTLATLEPDARSEMIDDIREWQHQDQAQLNR